MSISNTLARKHLNIKEGEEVLILTDTETDMDFAYAMSSACRTLGGEVTLITMPPSFLEREKDLTKIVKNALQGADVYIPMTPTTGKSVHSLDVAKLLAKRKLRELVVGGRHGGGLDLVLKAIREHNYEEVYGLTKKVVEFLSECKHIHITSPAGTDFEASIESIFDYKSPNTIMRWDGGIARNPGEECCFPDGEAWGGPVEGTAEGVIVIDGPISGVCNTRAPDVPVKLTVRKGKIVKVEGGEDAYRLREIISTTRNADNLAEIGFGTNRYMKFIGNIDQWDKRIWGTIHVAIGSNTYQIYPYGTVDSPIHNDMLIFKPTAVVDGKTILKEGSLVIT